MRRWFVLAWLVGCDEGEVVCAPAAYPETCGGYTATLCGQFAGSGEWVGGFVLWAGPAGRTTEIWDCAAAGCIDIPPNDIVCECAEHADWGASTSGFAGCE
jgi:hypothetical protein